jgi:hypothetical protein
LSFSVERISMQAGQGKEEEYAERAVAKVY